MTSESKEKAGGYGAPPMHNRFPPGQSGNRKGRPRGKRNFANVVRDVLEMDVPVRRNGKSERISTSEAAIRVQVAKAVKGDMRALNVLLDMMTESGRGEEVTEEVREQRSIVLPSPMSAEDFDLLASPGRAKERYWIVVEARQCRGDKHLLDDDISNALDEYRKEAGETNSPLVKAACIAGIGLCAEALLGRGRYGLVIGVIDLAFTYNPPFDSAWLSVIRAHALMFDDKPDEARKVYLSINTPGNLAGTVWENKILQEFAAFENEGRSHPLMNEVREEYRKRGWVAEIGNLNLKHPRS